VVSFAMLGLAKSLAMLFAARIVDGLSGGNITTARAYIADITAPEDRAKAFGILGAAFGLGFIVGPALGGLFSHISYTAPIWAAAIITVIATVLAYFWLPETVHRAHAGGASPWKSLVEMSGRPNLRILFGIDFIYWTAFAVYQTTFALFGARRFGFGAAQTGYLLAAFGFFGVLVQGVVVGRIAAAFGEKQTLSIGLAAAALGWGGSAFTHSVPFFIAMLLPGALGIGLCSATLSALISKAAGPHEQGRVQGAAGALESLGRTLGPMWGNGALQVYGEGTSYGSAALALAGAAAEMIAGAPLRMPQLVADALRPVGAHLRDASPALRQYVDGQLLIAAQAISGSANALYGAAALDMPRRGVAHVRGGIGQIAERLVEAIRGYGGRVLPRQRVTTVERAADGTLRARAQRGEEFPAQTVLFNLPPWDAGRLMAGDAPDALRRRAIAP
jgi:DHA1 family tetracycline resistance protein-like MFS transporter